MRWEWFIANRLVRSEGSKDSVTGPVITISITAIALGMVLMIIAVATGIGLQERIKDKIIGFSGHIQVQPYDSNISYEDQPINTRLAIYSDITDYEGFTHVQRTGNKAGILTSEEDFEGIALKGVGPEYDWSFFEEALEEGFLPSYRDGFESDSVIISRSTANRLRIHTGDEVVVYFIRESPKPPLTRYLYVTGIYNTGLEEFDRLYVLCDLDLIRGLNDWEEDEAGKLEVFIDDFDEIGNQTNTLREALPFQLNAVSVLQENPQLFKWLELFDVNIFLIIGIMLVVATINMIGALLILILERTRMIGIIKSIGGSDRKIRRIFLYQSGYLILRGLFWGNLIGIGLCLAQQYWGFVELDPSTYYVSEAPVLLDPWLILALNLGTLFICLSAMMFPSFLIMRIRPAKALRFD